MQKSLRKIFVCLLIGVVMNYSQDKKEWFPDNQNIQPFTANILEPKAGFDFLIAKSQIHLNIGTSRDLFRYSDENSSFSIGADLFTYSLLRSTGEFHFPVDAIDYLFGLNAGYKIKDCNIEYGARLRLSHISAHFVDGNFDYGKNSWRNGRLPQVYSREFIELFPFVKYEDLRLYSGFTYIFNVTPDYLGKEIYQAGFDYYILDFFSKGISPFAAYDFKLNKIEKFRGNNSVVLGIKFGKHDSKGFSIRFSYFSGSSIHGEYFDLNDNFSSLGFNLEL
jgi:hypothetical protein